MENTPLLTGVVLANRFVLEREAERGGIGTVYRGRDLTTNLPVAVKLLHLSPSPREAERFDREAQLLSELRHPGIVAYVGHGLSAEGNPFLAMEWLDGEDLTHRLRRQPLTVPESLLLLRRVAEAVAAAHQRGITHRDLKPSNLFLRDGQLERVTLLDFGIARRTFSANTLTRNGVAIGKPEYMAPELARSQRVIGPTADIFSLGCLLFECLTGHPPFVGGPVAAIIAKVLFEETPRLRNLRPELPESLENLLLCMLDKDSAKRIQDATELLAVMAQLVIPTEQVSSAKKLPAVVETEQRLVTVVIATPPVNTAFALTVDDTGFAAADTPQSAIERALVAAGAQVVSYPDGSIVSTWPQKGGLTVAEKAARAARGALLIRQLWPQARIAMATGRAVIHRRMPVGEAIDRVGLLLRSRAPSSSVTADDGIRVDEVTAGLIDAEFRINRTPEGTLLLCGDRNSADRPTL